MCVCVYAEPPSWVWLVHGPVCVGWFDPERCASRDGRPWRNDWTAPTLRGSIPRAPLVVETLYRTPDRRWVVRRTVGGEDATHRYVTGDAARLWLDAAGFGPGEYDLMRGAATSVAA